jgi:hypothetical protein
MDEGSGIDTGEAPANECGPSVRRIRRPHHRLAERDGLVDASTALANLGATEELLGAETRARLDDDGFALLPGILAEADIGGYQSRIAELSALERGRAGDEFTQEPGADRLGNLVNKGPLFDTCFTHPRVLAAVAYVLEADLKLSSLNSRAALPGQGHQALHVDWLAQSPSQEYQVCNSIWLLDDFTADNGATRVVPGSHRSRQVPGQVLDDPEARHPREVQLIAPAGTVVVFNGHLWHGGTRNRTTSPRRVMHGFFTRRQNPQQTDQEQNIGPETRARLSPAARFILAVE